MGYLRKSALALTFAWFFLLGTAQAQLFVGTVSSSAITQGIIVPFVGLHAGTYDLSGDFGIRGGFELLPAVITGLTVAQGTVDGFYATGEGIVFYAGPGLGVVSANGFTNVFVGGTVGVDFDAASVISYYVEAQPRYYFGGEPVFYIRSGLNFHIGL